MKRINLVLGILLSLAVLVYVFLSLDLQEVGYTFRSIRTGTLTWAFLLYFLNYILRTIRFKLLLDLHGIPFAQLLGVTNLYGMYLYLLPAKFGEVTFPLLLKKRLDVDISKATGTLIVARLFDFFTITLFLGVVLAYYWSLYPGNIKVVSIIFSSLVLVLFVLFVWMVRNPEKIFPLIERNLDRESLPGKLRGFIFGVYSGARIVETRRQYLVLIVVTIGIWLCVNGNFLLITSALGYSFDFFLIVVVSMIMVPVTLFPVQGFANLGAHEVGWITAFSLFGYDHQSALHIAISSHIVYVFFVILLGLSGFLLISLQQISRRRGPMQSPGL